MLNFVKLLKLLAPSLCIFYSISWSSLRPSRSYHEVFGNADYYLDLYFSTNPTGVLQRTLASERIGFEGFLVTGHQEERISGFLIRGFGEPRYIFNSSNGPFLGKRSVQPGRCEPQIQFKMGSQTGILKAGFCP